VFFFFYSLIKNGIISNEVIANIDVKVILDACFICIVTEFNFTTIKALNIIDK